MLALYVAFYRAYTLDILSGMKFDIIPYLASVISSHILSGSLSSIVSGILACAGRADQDNKEAEEEAKEEEVEKNNKEDKIRR